MLKRVFTYLFMLLLVAGYFLSCDEEKDIDPCQGKEPEIIDFTIGQRLTNINDFDSVFYSDTVLTDIPVQFAASGDYVSYQWKIGDDPRVFDTKTVGLYFQEPVYNATVTLIAEKRFDSCFPDQQLRDTISRQFSVLVAPAILGTYRGTSTERPNEEFDVTISSTGSGALAEYKITGINYGCQPEQYQFYVNIGYKSISFDGQALFSNGCNNPMGFAVLVNNNQTLEVYYSIRGKTSLEPIAHFVFKGRRL